MCEAWRQSTSPSKSCHMGLLPWQCLRRVTWCNFSFSAFTAFWCVCKFVYLFGTCAFMTMLVDSSEWYIIHRNVGLDLSSQFAKSKRLKVLSAVLHVLDQSKSSTTEFLPALLETLNFKQWIDELTNYTIWSSVYSRLCILLAPTITPFLCGCILHIFPTSNCPLDPPRCSNGI